VAHPTSTFVPRIERASARWSRRLLLLPALALAASCTESKPPEAAKPAPPKTAVAPTPPPPPAPPPAPEDKVTASISGKSDPECLAPLEDAAGTKPVPVKLGKRQGEITGYKLTLKGKPDEDDQAVVGVLGPINEASAGNLKLMDDYLKYFSEKGVEVIVVAGDVGDSKDSIQAALAKLGKTGLPVIAIAGNNDPRDGFRDALAAVRKTSPNVINGNHVRRIEWDDVTFFTLPGLHDKAFLHEEDGAPRCQYFAEDLDDLAESMKTAPAPVMLVAHDPPAGKEPGAIDYMGPQKHHAGDLNLTKLIDGSKIAFGVFPNIKEAGGIATADVAGAKALKPGQMSDSLYLNPGPADGSTAWTMNDGSSWSGGAAVITVKGKQASYDLYRAGTKPLAKDGP
jgi:Icc-related predicted phosphoesterase